MDARNRNQAIRFPPENRFGSACVNFLGHSAAFLITWTTGFTPKPHSKSARTYLPRFEIMLPPEKQDAQVIYNQRNIPVLFLESLLSAGRGWSANKVLKNAFSTKNHAKTQANSRVNFREH